MYKDEAYIYRMSIHKQKQPYLELLCYRHRVNYTMNQICSYM